MSSFLINFNFSENIRALFLLFLAISANFLGNTLNCSIQKKLSDNPIIRHLFILMIIYFTIVFASESILSPLEIFKNSLAIYVLFILLTKQTYEMFLFNFILLFIIFIIFIQIDYEKNKNKNVKENNTLQNNLENINKYLQYIFIVTLLIGFILYYNKQNKDYSKNFNLITFILGKNGCSNLK
jgi:hypothetical protein